MFDAIFDTPPFNLIRDYITGWTIIIFIIFIIYFVALRKYYINKEQFYYNNIDDTDNATENNDTENNYTDNIDNDDTDNIDDTDDTDNTDNTDNIDNDDTDNDVVENFAITNPLTTNPQTTNPQITTKTTPTPTLPSDPIFNKVIQDNIINTTLFDNLQLVPEQISKCKQLYNTVIINYISEFTKLLKLIKNNKFLNVDKEFNIILSKGIDSIIYFLNNDIKSMNILTRSSIKTDVLNITSNTIDYLIDKENIKLTNEINELARLNSTTIDYNSMVKNIDVSRKKIEDYIEMDKLISKYGYNNNISTNKVNSVLDKSFILPIYERNFDRINQLVNSDFNDNYTKLSEKYGKAYTEYLNQKKKEELNVNPLEMLSKIESGVVNFLTNITSNKTTHKINNKNNDLIEQYNSEYGYFNNTINQVNSNPVPKQNINLVNDTTLNKNNIYEDSGNLGNYLINDTAQKEILEGFVDTTTTRPNRTRPNTTRPNRTRPNTTRPNRTRPNTTRPNTTNPNTTKPNTTNPNTTKPNTTNPNTTKPTIITTKPIFNNNNKKQKEDTSIVTKLFSGEFLEYVMEVVNDKLNIFYTAYYKQFNNLYDTDTYDTTNTNKSSNFKLDDNLIPAGFLLFILSMLFYFIDLTS